MIRRGSPGPATYTDQRMSLRVLGPVEVEIRGELIKIGGMRQRKLLVMLLLNTRAAVTYDRIVDALWEAPPHSARQQIHNAIGSMRRSLATAASNVELITSEDGYRLHVADDLVDLRVFEAEVEQSARSEACGDIDRAVQHLQVALDLWRGPALSGLDGRYFSTTAARLNEQRLAAVERLMALRIRRGEAKQLVSELIGLVAEHPLRDALRGCLMVALHDSGRQGDALLVYDEGRELLVQELGLDPSLQLQEIQGQILRGEPVVDLSSLGVGLHADNRAHSEPLVEQGRAEPGSFLPHDTRDFTGRATEIARLLADSQDATKTALVISAVDGMGGIGKTALAVHVAHQIAAGYPDGQYFVDLHGFSVDADPVAPAQALEKLLTDVGIPIEAIPRDTDGRAALWRSWLAGKRALLLLDNARDESQVRPLLPGTAGVLVIVTSRRRLTSIEGALPLSLDVLSPDDAVRLFGQIVGDARIAGEWDTVLTVVDLCGRLPLAIQIAAARFRHRKTWDLAHLLSRIRTQRQRTRFLSAGDRNVMAVLTVSYQHLNPALRQFFRLLSLHPGDDFDAAAAAALACVSPEDAEQHLEALYDDSLLIQHRPGRFQFHDLVRDCARELLDRNDSEAQQYGAASRLIGHYLYLASALGRPMARDPFKFDPDLDAIPLSIPTPAHEIERLNILNAEYHNLLAVTRLAARAGMHRRAWQLACSILPLLRQRNYGGDSFELFQNAIEGARSIGDRAGEAASLTALALAHRERGTNKTAQELFRQAIAISDELGLKSWRAHQMAYLAVALIHDGRLQPAYDCLHRAHQLAQEIGDEDACAMLLNNLGVLARELGQYEDALTHFRKAISLQPSPASQRTQVLTAVNIGIVYHHQGRYEQAKATLTRVESDSRHLGAVDLQTTALSVLSATNRALGHYDSAIEHGRRALSIARRMGLQELECDALDALGGAYLATSDLTTSQAMYQQVEESAKLYGFPRYAACAHDGFAHICLKRGEQALAKHHWETALQTYPDGLAKAQDTRRHLAALGKEDVQCRRCTVATYSLRQLS